MHTMLRGELAIRREPVHGARGRRASSARWSGGWGQAGRGDETARRGRAAPVVDQQAAVDKEAGAVVAAQVEGERSRGGRLELARPAHAEAVGGHRGGG